MSTLRDSNGNRLCPRCGETLGINLGSQRRHDPECPVIRCSHWRTCRHPSCIAQRSKP